MVFQGQDAWRKHPLLAGCYRKPFPGLKTAVGIFATYVVVEAIYNYATAPTPQIEEPKVKYFDRGTAGSNMPGALVKTKVAHH